MTPDHSGPLEEPVEPSGTGAAATEMPVADQSPVAPPHVDVPAVDAEPDEAQAPLEAGAAVEPPVDAPAVGAPAPVVVPEPEPEPTAADEPERTAFAEPPAWEPGLPTEAGAPDPSAQAGAPEPTAAEAPEASGTPDELTATPSPLPDEAGDPDVAAAPAPYSTVLELEPTAVPDQPRGGGVLLPVLSALAVVLVALVAYLGVEVKNTSGAAPIVQTREEAVASAREAARLVFSYDYRHLAKDFAAGKAVTTGDFSKEYDRTTAKLVDDFAPRYKAVVTADVSASSVVRATQDEVVCLLFVNQVSTSTLVTAPKVTQSRLEMTMRRVDGRWKVAKIDAL